MKQLAIPLTPRQAEVLSVTAETGCMRKTAIVLGLSKRTVGRHIELAEKKLRSANWVQAVVMWDRLKRGEA